MVGIYLIPFNQGQRVAPSIVQNSEVSGFARVGIQALGDQYGYSKLSIFDNEVYGNGDGIVTHGQHDNPTAPYPHADVLISGNHVHNNLGTAAGLTNSGSGIKLGTADGAVITDNDVHHNGGSNTGTGGGPVGIWTFDSSDVLIEHNSSYNNATGNGVDGGGFDADGGSQNVIIRANLSYDNEGPGYLAAHWDTAHPTSAVDIQHNISINDGGPGALAVWRDENADEPMTSVRFTNNTVWTNGTAVSIVGGDAGIGFTNNILRTVNGQDLVHSAWSTAEPFFLHNLYWGSNLYQTSAGTHTGLDEWRAEGYEMFGPYPLGIHASPQLTNPGSSRIATDYKPITGSPAINAGVDLTFLFWPMGTHAYDGTLTPQASVRDIGAYEQ